MDEENMIGTEVEILATGETGEVVEHFPDIGELEVSLRNGWIETSEDEVKPLDEIEIKCPKCGDTFPKSELEEMYEYE